MVKRSTAWFCVTSILLWASCAAVQGADLSLAQDSTGATYALEDEKSGLEWSLHLSDPVDSSGARLWAITQDFGLQDDWRIPTKAELDSLLASKIIRAPGDPFAPLRVADKDRTFWAVDMSSEPPKAIVVDARPPSGLTDSDQPELTTGIVILVRTAASAQRRPVEEVAPAVSVDNGGTRSERSGQKTASPTEREALVGARVDSESAARATQHREVTTLADILERQETDQERRSDELRAQGRPSETDPILTTLSIPFWPLFSTFCPEELPMWLASLQDEIYGDAMQYVATGRRSELLKQFDEFCHAQLTVRNGHAEPLSVQEIVFGDSESFKSFCQKFYERNHAMFL